MKLFRAEENKILYKNKNYNKDLLVAIKRKVNFWKITDF
jgi:hypothetical protein